MSRDIYIRKINWEWGLRHPKNTSFWRNASGNYNITLRDVRQYQDYIVWSTLSANYRFLPDISFLDEFKDKIDWDTYTRYHSMSEEIYRRFKDRIDFTTWYFFASKGHDRSYLEKYYTEVKDWGRVLIYLNVITNDMLKKYSYLFDEEAWSTISYHFELTEEIVKKYKDKLDLEGLKNNPYVQKEWLKIFENK